MFPRRDSFGEDPFQSHRKLLMYCVGSEFRHAHQVLQGTDANNNAAFRAGSHDHSFLMPKSMLITINIQSISPDLSLICGQLTAET